MPYQFPTPYINPAILTSAPTGISWSSIPFRQASPGEQLAEQYNICQRSSNMVDTAANQVLRATITTEQFKGPGTTRWQLDGGGAGNSTVLLARGPILEVLGGSIATAILPVQWTPIPASQFMINSPPLGIYGTSVPGDAGEFGQSVTVGAQGLGRGRGGSFLQVQYKNGWPHCSLTQTANAGDTALHVDDVTGWAPPAGMSTGAAGVLYDSLQGQETAVVTAASTSQGPGTLTLSTGLSFAHEPGVICSALPSQLSWACIVFAISQALIRGATATTPQTISPSGVKTSDGADALAKCARQMVRDFRRVW